MGSGKTTWAINQLINKSEENILFVTPYCDECARIQRSARKKIHIPKQLGDGKLGNLGDMLQDQLDIASTHALFKMLDDRCKTAIENGNYTLILDETIDAVSPYHFQRKDDYRNLLERQDISVDENGLIQWTGKNYDTRYNDVRLLAQNKCLFRVDDKFFLWHYPIDVFKLFKQVFILTYMFDGSYMKPYFDYYGINYRLKSVKQIDDRYALVDYIQPKPSRCKNKINIYEGNLNDTIEEKSTALSSSWFKSRYHKNDVIRLKNNIFNYVHNITKAKSSDVLWTTFKAFQTHLRGKGYTKGFLSCNARATNEYADRTVLIYALNWFPNPEIVKFFKQRDIAISADAVALSNMVQWVWRSAIRNGEPISIYIPSKRMRELLKKWLNDAAPSVPDV